MSGRRGRLLLRGGGGRCYRGCISFLFLVILHFVGCVDIMIVKDAWCCI